MAATNLASEKSFVFDFVDRNEAAVATIGDSVFYFGELGMQEVESAKLMTGLLEEAGFAVERGISGFPTGFCATFGAGEPVIAQALRQRIFHNDGTTSKIDKKSATFE